MEALEQQWKEFLNKKVKIIINDLPSPYPKTKDGVCIGVTNTHILLQQSDKEIALLLTDIRRIEVFHD